MSGRSQTLPIGTDIGGFAIVRVLGQGGFGITYEATNILGDRYAVKEFFPLGIASREDATLVTTDPREAELAAWALDRFKRTTIKLARLSHPNIVKVFHYIPGETTGFMIMDFVDGRTLADHLADHRARTGRPPTLAELRPLVEPALDALSYLHGAGLVHRDVAPDNLMIRRDGVPVLIDFGAMQPLARDGTRLEVATRAIGKPHYASPEQLNASSELTPASDVYSLGAVLYYALAGEKPADAGERRDGVVFRNTDPYRPLATIANVPERAAAAIDAALRLRPDERPRDVPGLREALGWAAAPLPARPLPASEAPAPAPASPLGWNPDAATPLPSPPSPAPASVAPGGSRPTPISGVPIGAAPSAASPVRARRAGRGALAAAAAVVALLGGAAAFVALRNTGARDAAPNAAVAVVAGAPSAAVAERADAARAEAARLDAAGFDAVALRALGAECRVCAVGAEIDRRLAVLATERAALDAALATARRSGETGPLQSYLDTCSACVARPEAVAALDEAGRARDAEAARLRADAEERARADAEARARAAAQAVARATAEAAQRAARARDDAAFAAARGDLERLGAYLRACASAAAGGGASADVAAAAGVTLGGNVLLGSGGSVTIGGAPAGACPNEAAARVEVAALEDAALAAAGSDPAALQRYLDSCVECGRREDARGRLAALAARAAAPAEPPRPRVRPGLGGAVPADGGAVVSAGVSAPRAGAGDPSALVAADDAAFEAGRACIASNPCEASACVSMYLTSSPQTTATHLGTLRLQASTAEGGGACRLTVRNGVYTGVRTLPAGRGPSCRARTEIAGVQVANGRISFVLDDYLHTGLVDQRTGEVSIACDNDRDPASCGIRPVGSKPELAGRTAISGPLKRATYSSPSPPRGCGEGTLEILTR